jgi:hypothetical protein
VTDVRFLFNDFSISWWWTPRQRSSSDEFGTSIVTDATTEAMSHVRSAGFWRDMRTGPVEVMIVIRMTKRRAAPRSATEMAGDLRRIRKTTVRGELINDIRQHSGKLGQQLLLTHSPTREFGDRHLAE